MTTLFDIGRTREAERELAVATAGIHEMVRFPEMNPGPVVRLALNGTVLRANAAASAIFEVESLEGECLWDLLPDLDEAVRARVLQEGAPSAKTFRSAIRGSRSRSPVRREASRSSYTGRTSVP